MDCKKSVGINALVSIWNKTWVIETLSNQNEHSEEEWIDFEPMDVDECVRVGELKPWYLNHFLEKTRKKLFFFQ